MPTSRFNMNVPPKFKKTTRRKPRFTQRKAYKPRQKRRMRMKRQPFVETKKVIEESYAGIINPRVDNTQPTAWTRTFSNVNISPVSNFLFMSRGYAMDQMVGRDIYSKGLKQKIQINLPQGKLPSTTARDGNENRPFHRITRTCPVYIVWGWIKQPLGSVLDPLNANDPQPSRWSVDDVKRQIDHVTDSGKDLMSNPYGRGHGSDYLTFPDKRKSMWTMKVRLLKPTKLKSSVMAPESKIVSIHNASNPAQHVGDHTADFGDYSAYTGYAGVLQTTISWKTNRKIRYAGPEAGTPSGIARDTWVPYSYIYVPQEHHEAFITASNATYNYLADGSANDGTGVTAKSYKDLVNDCSAEVRTCHWFSDS